MKIFYHNDADGRCAGAIAYRSPLCQMQAELIEMEYSKRVPVETIRKDEVIIIVDFSFKPEVMEEVLERTRNIIWIDHHKTNMYDYGVPIKGLRDVDYSGCELAWIYFTQIEGRRKLVDLTAAYKYGLETMPRAVVLIGDRDKWAWKYGEETAMFNMGLKLYPHEPDDVIWDDLLDNRGSQHILGNAQERRLKDILEKGKVCIRFRDMVCEDYCESYGFETEFEGYRCFALGLYMFGSEAFGERIKEYDICLSYEYLGDNWIVGLYSEKVDVGEIARRYGEKYGISGGGHRGAAGFVAPELPFRKLEVG